MRSSFSHTSEKRVPFEGSSGNSWRIQLRVFAAVFSKEIDSQSAQVAFGFLLTLFEPLFHIGVLCLWHLLMRTQPIYGTSIVLFISTGIYPIFVFVHLSSHTRALSGAGASRRFPIELPLDFVISGTCMIIFSYTVVGVLLFTGIAIFGSLQAIPFDFQPILEALTALACLGFGTGLCNAVVQRLFPAWRYFWGGLARALIIFSGALYVADFLPTYLRDVLVWNPILHAVERFRQGFYPFYPTLIYDPSYLWGFSMATLVGGVCLQRLLRRRLG